MSDDSGSQSPTVTLAIALPAQIPRSANGYHGAVGSREDCWTEPATAVLIDAWGERYLQLSRGNLKQNHWKEVADVVAEKEEPGKVVKTDVQCKNRIDTVKKKFKAEKAKIAANGGVGKSSWIFFDKMDYLIGPVIATPNPIGSRHIASEQFLSGSGPVRSVRIQNQKLKNRRSKRDSDSDPDPPSEDSTDSLPPETKYPYKRARTHREFNSMMNPSFDTPARPQQGQEREGGWGDSMRELTRAIVKFGEMYEKAERLKVQQMMELEKHRMTFTKEIEMQRMQFFTKTQLEILQRRNGNRNNNHRHHHINNNHDDNDVNNHHSDSSS